MVSSVPLTAFAASVGAAFTAATVSEAVTVTGVPPSDTTAVRVSTPGVFAVA